MLFAQLFVLAASGSLQAKSCTEQTNAGDALERCRAAPVLPVATYDRGGESAEFTSAERGRIAPFKIERVPRLVGRADATLWRRALNDEALGSGVTVFVKPENARAVQILRQFGVETNELRWAPKRLDMATMHGLLSSLGDFELRAALPHRPLLDRSLIDVGLAGRDPSVIPTYDHRYSGKGVLVGLIDTGLDLSHPAFRNPDGSTRVVAVWDQDGVGAGAPSDFGYGTECTRTELLAEECAIGDSLGHGTHVAGIAAGSLGVAPKATIAVVRSNDFTRLADAVSYILNVGRALDLPVVVNVSVGGQYGPHDGRTPLEMYLGSVMERGEVIVAAAGNDGANRIHFGATLRDEPVRVGIDSLPHSRSAETTVELWSELVKPVELTLEYWVDGKAQVAVPLRAHDSELLVGSLDHEGRSLISLLFAVEADGWHRKIKHTLTLARLDVAQRGESGRLVLAVSGAGRLDGWLNQSDYRFGAAQFGTENVAGWISGDSELSLAVPATAASVITVGAYTTRTAAEFPQHALLPLPLPLMDGPLGAMSPFSSRGPVNRAHPYVKPDLTAPGSAIVSARGQAVLPGPLTLDDYRVIMQGTSMAAPHVSGVVALMLEANPELTAADVKQILRDNARSDAFTGNVPNAAWGQGKLDAAAAITAAENHDVGCSAQASGWPAIALCLALLARRRYRCA